MKEVWRPVQNGNEEVKKREKPQNWLRALGPTWLPSLDRASRKFKEKSDTFSGEIRIPKVVRSAAETRIIYFMAFIRLRMFLDARAFYKKKHFS